MKRLIISTIIATLLCACSSPQGHFSVIAPQGTDLNIFGKQMRKTRVTGTDSQNMFAIFSLGDNLSIDDAVKDALQKANADYLIDADVTLNWWWVIVGQKSLTIKATAVKAE